MNDQQPNLQRVRKLSDLLDTRYTGPFGIKFGVDALLGLLPVVGDFATSILSFSIVFQAALAGCPMPILLRMISNILIENVMDLIPLLGNIFDVVWKSNRKNVALWENYLREPHATNRNSVAVLISISIILLLILSLSVYLGYRLFLMIFQYFMGP